jgi:hypothetical protein
MGSDPAYRAAIEERLEDFAVWLAVYRPSGRQVSHASIAKYVSEVRGWYRRYYRTELGLGAKASRIGDILRGYQREVQQPPRLDRVGCTPADLGTALARRYGDGSAADRMWRAALTFGMGAMARACEFALDVGRGEAFEISEHLTPADVEFFFRDGVRHARVRMRKRKDLKVLRGKQCVVLLAGGGRHFDAVEELFQWIEARAALGLSVEQPLFCYASGQSISTAEVRDEVKAAMHVAGRDPSRYGGHSLRIGGATAALAAGVSPTLIRLMGRWSSDIYELYCRMSVEAALGVGQAIASAEVTSVDAGFHEEHFELQASEVAAFGWPAEEGGDVDEREEEVWRRVE